MVVYIVIGKMNRIKEKTLIEIKETLKKKREEYNKCYLEKKESKNKTTDVLIAKLQDRLVQCCIDFINENNPKYSIISVGKNNRYGHPNKEVLDNLEKSKIYRTDQDGSIMFKIKNNKLKIETCSP